MRRSGILALGLVLAATTSLAPIRAEATQTPPVPMINLGHVTPKGGWEVGTVNPEDAGSAYCAMVGHFDKHVVFAIARNPDGFNSVALDFRDRFFEPGQMYPVKIDLDGAASKEFEGRAGSDRSLIVQIGKENSFFEALQRSSDISFSLPTLQIAFPLNRFTASYNKLVNCSGELREDLKEASLKVEDVNTLPGLSADADKLAQQQEAYAEKLATLGKREIELEQKLQQQRAEAERLAKQRQELENLRQSAKAADISALETKAAALEKRLADQMAVNEQLKAALNDKEGKLVELASSRGAQVQAASTDFAVKEQELLSRIERLEQERDDLDARLKSLRQTMSAGDDAQEVSALVKQNRSLQMQLVAKQKEIADLQKERESNSEALTDSLAGTEVELGSKIAAIAAERDALKKQLAETENLRAELEEQKQENARLLAGLQATQDKLAGMEKSLTEVTAAKTEIEERLARQERQNKQLELALAGKKDALEQEGAPADEIAAVTSELQTVRAERDALVASLKGQLAEKTQEVERLKATIEAGQSAMAQQQTPDENRLATALAEKQQTITTLEQQLSSLKQERDEAVARVATMQEELQSVRNQLAQKTSGADIGELASARSEIQRLKESLAENHNQITALEQRNLELERAMLTADKSSVESVRQKTEQDKGWASLWSDNGYENPSETAGPDVAAAPAQNVASETLGTVTETASKATSSAVAFVAKATEKPAVEDTSAAAAFLDRIMAVHRGELPADEFDTPVTQKATAVAENTAAPVQAEPAKMPASKTDNSTHIASVSDEITWTSAAVEPAAGMDESVTSYERPDFVPEQPVVSREQAQPQQVQKKPQPVPLAEKTVVAQEPVTLEILLAKSGLSQVQYVPVSTLPGEVVVQWTTGNASGMYEQLPVTEGVGFGDMTASYIDRYRADCATGITVSLSEPEQTNAGMVATADISCAQEGNAYTTSFVFNRKEGYFNAVLHSGYPQDKEKVRSIRNNVAQSLKATGGLVVRQPVVKKTNMSQAQPVSQKPKNAIEIETVVVE